MPKIGARPLLLAASSGSSYYAPLLAIIAKRKRAARHNAMRRALPARSVQQPD
ncbi:MAG: hypothetical protein Q4A11_05095 [Brachymonas sp.]|nr:hypothetical protein [Brachymonas sp.]